MKSKISVIVPIYNAEKYLKRCIDSILIQTFSDFELILVDDGSSDNSGAICKEFQKIDERIIYLFQNNSGVSIARNNGMKKAQGEWLAFVDSDDWIEKDTFEIALKVAEAENVDMVQYGLVFSNDVSDYRIEHIKSGKLRIPSEQNIYGWMRGPYTRIIRKKICDEYNIFFPERIELAEDFYFTFKCFYYTSNVYSLDIPLYHYYYNEKSAVHTMNEKKIKDEENVIKQLEIFIKEQNSRKEWNKEILFAKELFKKKFLFLDRPNIKKWRECFPECNGVLYRKRNKASVVYLLIYLHLDVFAKILIKLWIKKR